ncbi:MAG: J domain-containing protein [Pseudomonadota bacterium]
MTDFEKAFAILGVSPTDDEATIRKAWRALVRSYHPDTARTDPVGANKRLTEINVAYDVVSACSPSDLARLKTERAKKIRTAERLRAEKLRQEKARLQKQEQQRKAQEAARKAEAEAARKASIAARSVKFDEKPRKDEQKDRVETAPASVALVAKSKPADRSRNADKAQSLVALAEQGFVEAMKACARHTFLPTRSSYA